METRLLTHASLFSGIGGAEIAAAWVGWKNVFHCDINEFGCEVLRFWFPESKEYHDISKTDFTEWGGGLWTCLQQDSLVSHSASQESEEEKKTSVISGRRLSAHYEKSGQLGSLVRMCLESSRWYSPVRELRWLKKSIYSERIILTKRSSVTFSTEYATTSSRQDMKSSRLLFQLVPSERRIGEIEFGFLRGGKMEDFLKTPTAMDASGISPKANPIPGSSGCLAQELKGGYAKLLPKTAGGTSQDSMGGKDSHLSAFFSAEMMGFPKDWLVFPFLSRYGIEKRLKL